MHSQSRYLGIQTMHDIPVIPNITSFDVIRHFNILLLHTLAVVVLLSKWDLLEWIVIIANSSHYLKMAFLCCMNKSQIKKGMCSSRNYIWTVTGEHLAFEHQTILNDRLWVSSTQEMFYLLQMACKIFLLTRKWKHYLNQLKEFYPYTKNGF